MSTSIFPNLEIAKQHIELLTGSADTSICFRLIHDSDKKAPASKLTGTVTDLWPKITEAQVQGYGAYFVINEGGNYEKDITKVRSIYVDADNKNIPETWHETPDFLVYRDSTHWHAYWICEGLLPESFKEAQLRLIALYKTDPQVFNLSRVMRLAGSLHLKDPTHPKLVTLETFRDNWEGKRQSSELLASLPVVEVKKSTEQKAASSTLDLKENVARAAKLLQTYVTAGDVAVEGAGGDNRTFQLFCEVQNLGISPDKSVVLIENIWNPNCLPPWSHDELCVKSENAANYAQNEAGAWAVAPAQETFSTALGKLAAEDVSDEPERRSKFYFEDDEEQDTAPDPVWLVPDLIPDNTTILLVGESGSFKSFFAEDLALAISTSRETFGNIPLRAGPTFYGAHEGRNEIKKLRKRAWKIARDVEGKVPFFVARAPQIALPEQCEEFREQIRVRLRQSRDKIAMIILDTVAKCMVGLNENDARDCGIFIAYCDSLRDEFECPVMALHHFGKDAERGGRGSSALPAGFDTIVHVKRITDTTAVEIKVQQHKDADERKKPWTFEGRPIAGSLVFFPTTAEEHRLLSGKADDLTPRNIGKALQALNAYGAENGVTTAVLASLLIPPDQNRSVEDHQSMLEKTSRVLKHLAKGSLEAYCEKTGRNFIWSLPAPEAKQ